MTTGLNRDAARQYLKGFQFRDLFIEELGWNHLDVPVDPIEVDGFSYAVEPVAEKQGVQVFVVPPGPDGEIPSTPIRSKLDNRLRRIAHEHLLIFVDGNRQCQTWLWVKREEGHAFPRSNKFNVHQQGEQLLQNLEKIRFTFEDEGKLRIMDVTGQLRAAFDKDKVTKKFYQLFDKERKAFEKLIEGIPDEDMQRWYVSVMINRLMFIYFIQRRGYLGGGDQDYLANRLHDVQEQFGKDHYYQTFLCPLFFKGFAEPAKDRDDATNKLLGQVPYLDGGLFMQHQVEELHGQAIEIKDSAFEKLFAFFDQYQWHLDETAIENDNEINPDVLGYIFEKYINQKQMGAYYTKEDITGYISQNTIIPFLLQRMQEQCAVAFEPGGSVWKLLQDDPDRYIYSAVRKGVIDGEGEVIPESALPGFVQEGMHDPKKRMFEKYYNLGLADPKLRLPTETWREYVERRKRCLELREKLAAGGVTKVNDLITYNLDIRKFALDVVQQAGGSDLVKACWIALNGDPAAAHRGHVDIGITVLDPTVGSGAFLFSALNVLHPLYEACLQRMEDFVEAAGKAKKPNQGDTGFFRKVIGRIADHQDNREYFILKSIVVDNLYGVDIMEEACEICKLRLFLKLVAQVKDVDHIEPLPDIDFNIRAGNTLVGFANEKEVEAAIRPIGKDAKIDFEDELPQIHSTAKEVAKLFDLYRNMQVHYGAGSKILGKHKAELREKLAALTGQLDVYLAGQYKVQLEDSSAFKAWRDSHKPFHWWAEFYGIISKGGFDVIIGNPPYVEYSKVKKDYKVLDVKSLTTGDVYAFILERAMNVSSEDSFLSMIIPISAFSVDKFQPIRDILIEHNTAQFISNWSGDAHPSHLFEGVDKRLSIVVIARTGNPKNVVFTSKYYKWYADERGNLFSQFPRYECQKNYGIISEVDKRIGKISVSLHSQIMKKVHQCVSTIGSFENKNGDSKLYYTPWIQLASATFGLMPYST